MDKRIKIKDDRYLTMGIYEADNGHQEICIGIEDECGCALQDVVVVDKDIASDDIICRVYGCADIDDYTHKFKIELWESEEI